MDSTIKSAEVTVFRYDPTIDKKPHYQMYEVPYEGYTVQNVLQYIYDNCDKSISFRSGCMGKGGGRCGGCGMLVNGVPALACQKMAEEKMVIEPHPKFEHLKDLIVDFNKPSIYQGKQHVKIIVDTAKCVGCNDCVLICPVGVYQLKKFDGKNKAVPIDIQSCCGLSCQLCMNLCWKDAITVQPVIEGNRG